MSGLNNNVEQEMTLRDIILGAKEWFFYFLSQFKIIFVCGVLGAALGLGYAFLEKPVYTAVITFALEDEKSGGGLSSALAGQFGLDLGTNGGGMFSGSNLIELFKSRKMVEKTLLTASKKQKVLAEDYMENIEMRKSWQDKPKLKALKFIENLDRSKFTREQDSVLGIISNNIIKSELTVLQKEKKISIITIEYKSTNELFAKNFSETLAKEVSEFYIETKSKKARKNLVVLQKQTDSVRGSLDNSIAGVAIATDNTFGLNPALNIKRVPSSRKQVDVQANSVILAELVKQTEIAKVTVRKDTPLIQIIDTPIMPLPKEKLGKLKGLLIGGIVAGFLSVFYFAALLLLSKLNLSKADIT